MTNIIARWREVVFVVTVVIVVPLTATPRAGQTPDEALQRFERLVDEYVTLHRRLEGGLPPLKRSSDPREIDEAVTARARAIRKARPDARAGDIFGPEVSIVLRRAIQTALADQRCRLSDLLAEGAEEVLPDTPNPVVNAPFPWGRGSAMWPCLLTVLPALPPELQYRLVHRDLVLVDIEADLVVDILCGALGTGDAMSPR